MEIIKECKDLISLLEDHKAENIIAFNVSGQSPYADYIVLATAPNERALEAYRDILIEYEEKKNEPVKSEGNGTSGWIIIDAEAVVIHLMLQGKREEIALEELLNKSKKN